MRSVPSHCVHALRYYELLYSNARLLTLDVFHEVMGHSVEWKRILRTLAPRLVREVKERWREGKRMVENERERERERERVKEEGRNREGERYR